MQYTKICFLLLSFLIFFYLSSGCTVKSSGMEENVSSADITQPEQPLCGPGGKDYSHSGVSEHCYGEGEEEYWIFEPWDPVPEKAPVIVFLHGWGGIRPEIYYAWIEHMVKRGNIVIFPRYQENLRTGQEKMMNNSLKAIKEALKKLEEEENHVRPDREKFAVVGHSYGGVLGPNIAVMASSEGLPEVKALMSAEPGDPKSITGKDITGIILDSYAGLPENMLLLAVVGAEDTLVEDKAAKQIIKTADSIPGENKNLVILNSDYYGTPPLIADHSAPVTGGKDNHLSGTRRLDALDYYCFWKLFDGLCDAAFYDKNREYALGNRDKQCYMGEWSDGTPVKTLTVLTDF